MEQIYHPAKPSNAWVQKKYLISKATDKFFRDVYDVSKFIIHFFKEIFTPRLDTLRR
jgi:hypothetical protein